MSLAGRMEPPQSTGGEKLAAYYEKREASAQKVIPLKTGTEK